MERFLGWGGATPRHNANTTENVPDILCDELARSAHVVPSLSPRASAPPSEAELDRAYAPLIDAIRRSNSRVVLIGEASHGTHDFYVHRCEISKRLMASDMGFSVVGLEADFPAAHEVNRWARSDIPHSDEKVESLLDRAFTRWPAWMWANTAMADFFEFMRRYNAEKPDHVEQIGVYGLDLYSLVESRDKVIEYLKSTGDAELLREAKQLYKCFSSIVGGTGEESEEEDEQEGKSSSSTTARRYGVAMAARRVPKTCEDEVVRVLETMVREHGRLADLDKQRGRERGYASAEAAEEDGVLWGRLNARCVKGAEQYYRNMMHGGVTTWNVRDTHMFESLREILDFRQSMADRRAAREGRQAPTVRALVFAHNSHLGNAAESDRVQSGKLNIGQLVREHYGDRCFAIGFSTHTGTVTAAHSWDSPEQHMDVNPSMRGSWEELWQRAVRAEARKFAGGHDAMWLMRDYARTGAAQAGMQYGDDQNDVESKRAQKGLVTSDCVRQVTNLAGSAIARYIGVLYKPRTERQSHYIRSRQMQMYDAVIHCPRSHALRPLGAGREWHAAHHRTVYGQNEEPVPETYPFGE